MEKVFITNRGSWAGSFFLALLCMGGLSFESWGMSGLRHFWRSSNSRAGIVAASLFSGLAYTAKAHGAANVDQEPNASNYEVFKRVQDIIAVAEKVRVSEKGELDSGQEQWPGVDRFDRTQKGLYLRLDDYPKSLGTPWGRVRLIGGGIYGGFIERLNAEFFKHVKLSFERNVCDVEKDNQLPFYIKRVSDVTFYQTDPKTHKTTAINKSDLRGLKGSDAIITADPCGCESIYKVLAVNGKVLPATEYLPNPPHHPIVQARIKSHGSQTGNWSEHIPQSDPIVAEYYEKLSEQIETADKSAATEWNSFTRCYKKQMKK